MYYTDNIRMKWSFQSMSEIPPRVAGDRCVAFASALETSVEGCEASMSIWHVEVHLGKRWALDKSTLHGRSWTSWRKPRPAFGPKSNTRFESSSAISGASSCANGG